MLKIRSLIGAALLTLAAGSLPACSSDEQAALPPEETLEPGEPLIEGDCDPLVPTQCGFPFPSDVWTREDLTTPTKKRVAFGKTTLPKATASPTPTDPSIWNDSDGFSPGSSAITHMPGATIAGLPTQDTLDLSIGPDSPTVLLDAETLERVPHFAELDMTTNDDDERTFIIRPVVRLKDSARYIVAIRRVKDAAGRALDPSPTFKALRDGSRYLAEDISVGRRRALYADIFSRLAKAGIAKEDLQLAWDYTTASRENNTKALLKMRDDALALVGADGPEYAIDSVEIDPEPHIWKRILGRMTVPLYLDKPESGGRLVLGPDGLPKQNGTAEFGFIVHIPNSVKNGAPAPLLQNGHGLLGSKTEGQGGYLTELADLKNYVAVGVDLVGMAGDDQVNIANTISTDVGGFRALIDRQHQGVINSLLAMRMMKGRFVNDPEAQYNGKSVIDPTRCFYRGDSQGGIFGTTYMAVSTDVTRGLLGEPGMPYNLLLSRSTDFGIFFVLLTASYHSARAIQLGLGAVQMLWDRTEPNGYAPYIAENMLPGTPKHDVLLHVAIGDYQVTPLGAHLIARTVKAKNLTPVNRTVWGVDESPGPITGSAMVEFDFGLPESPTTNVPPSGPSGDDPHDKVRKLGVAFDQTDAFFRTGVVEPACMGPCDPE